MLEKIKSALKTQEPIEPIKGTELIDKQYRRWRLRTMYTMMIGYASFYFVRKNIAIANPEIRSALNITELEFGLILSAGTFVYAFSKFFSGVLADRSNPRYFMALGLLTCAVVNIFFGLSSALIAFIIFWALNNLFQGMGMPPCSRLLTLWFSPKESGRAWGIWNSSHQLGGMGVSKLSALLLVILPGILVGLNIEFLRNIATWRYLFFIPAGIAILMAFFIINRLRDTPESLGLPPVEVYKKDISSEASKQLKEEAQKETSKEIFFKYVLKNKMVWIVSFANFFIYIVRIGLMEWIPSFLQASRGFNRSESADGLVFFELFGMVGAFLAGLFSDKIFKGRRGPVSALFMLLLMLCIFILIRIPAGNYWPVIVALGSIGFFVYGPQMLVAVAAADFATKKAAATAVGLTGFVGYMGATVSNSMSGFIAQSYGWNGTLIFYFISAAIGFTLFIFTWNKRSEVLNSQNEK